MEATEGLRGPSLTQNLHRLTDVSLGDRLDVPPGTGARLVLLESSHKAKN